MLAKLKNFVKNNTSDIFIISVVILVALIAFGVGRLTVPKSEPIVIKNLEQGKIDSLTIPEKSVQQENVQVNSSGKVVASKNSDKYHLPECPGAKQISEENKIWFDSIEAAENAGYEPAGNCPGLNQ